MQRFPKLMFNPRDFADDTDFERLVLDRLGTHRVRPAEAGSVHNLRGPRPNVIVSIASVVSGTQLRDELRESLQPLGFSAAYKVLDMLVEHVLRANGAGAGRLRFHTKARALASRPPALPPPLDSRPDQWDRLAAAYIALQQARHAVTHRRAQATATGELEIYDNARRLTDTVTSAEIRAFAAAVHTVAELVIDESGEQRRITILDWHLNELRSRHRFPDLPAVDPNAGRRRLEMDLEDLGDGRLRWDVRRAKEAVDVQIPSLWDLRLHAGGRVFVGLWEDVPDTSAAAVDFHTAPPPPWLSEEIESA